MQPHGSHGDGPTVREKLLALHKSVSQARDARDIYLIELRQAGYTVRQLAGVLGVAPATIMRWAALPDGEDVRLSLDGPA